MARGVHKNTVRLLVLLTLAQSGCAPSSAQAEIPSTSTPAYTVGSGATDVAEALPLRGELLVQLSAKEWRSVARAAREVKGRGGEALPLLMELMRRDQKVKLVNTADLIYPGAETFYGHGYVVSYDIDWLPVRAGWILEELTFQEFGFREGGLSGEDLMEATVQTRHEGKFDVPLDEAVKLERDQKLRAKSRSAAVGRAMDWWVNHQQGWTRVAALQQALESDSPARQVEALSYLRYPDSGCPGLDLEVYRRRLRPLVEKFAVGGAKGYEGVRAQA